MPGDLHHHILFGPIKLLKITLEISIFSQNIWRKVVEWSLINISPSNISRKKCSDHKDITKIVFGCCRHEWVISTNSHVFKPFRLRSSKAQGYKDFYKPSKPCCVGIHWIALAEYSQMSTHMPGFHSFFSFFAAYLVFDKISHQLHKG